MKYSGRRIIIVSIAMVMALAMIATTTYAWFSMNQETFVNDFNVQVTAEDGLLISTSATGVYKTTLNNEDIDGAYNRYYNETTKDYGFRLVPVSLKLKADGSIDTTTGYQFEKLNKELNVNNPSAPYKVAATAYANDNTKATGDYFVFEVFFKSSIAMDIVMTKTDIKSAIGANPTTPQEIPNSMVGILKNKYTTNFAQGEDSATLAFINKEKIKAEAANAARIAFKSDTTSYVINPNATKGFNVGNFAQDYFNAHGRYTIADYQYMKDEYVLEGNNVLKTQAEYQKTVLTTLKVDAVDNMYKGSVKIFLWIDGTDGDCFDSILNDTIATWMRFEGIIVNP
ncbi:MAG: hypothetical protein RR054_01215 [Clostridia bacterium]